VDPAHFESERRKIFARHWALVTHSSAIPNPGDYFAGRVANWPIIVVRHADGTLRGFHNVCRHRASMLVGDGKGRFERRIHCRYHAWAYDMDGTLQATPGFGAAANFDLAANGLFPIRAQEWRGFVFVCFDNRAESLRHWLGPIDGWSRNYDMESMKHHSSHTFHAAINWKTYGDNYLEDYHLPYLHPGLVKSIDTQKLVYRTLLEEQLFIIDAARREGGLTGGLWFYKYPTTMFNLYEWGMSIARVDPLSVDTLAIENWYFFADTSAEREAANAENARWSRAIIEEDLVICEGVQRNLSIGMYTQGRLSPNHEEPVFGFQNMIRHDLQLADVDLFAGSGTYRCADR
jgi:choline monooxygenase